MCVWLAGTLRKLMRTGSTSQGFPNLGGLELSAGQWYTVVRTMEIKLTYCFVWKYVRRIPTVVTYIHIIFLPHDTIYFVECTNPSCSKAPQQHDAATPALHGWDGVHPANITMVIMAKQFYFWFIRPEDISPKSTIFVPMCNCKP